MTFEKTRCIENIYALAKKKGLKIGEMEEKAGVSKGYLSRINKEDSTANPPIDLLVSIADQLDVSVDFLIGYANSDLSENEDFIFKYVDKLLKKTNEGKLEWIIQSRSILTVENGDPVDNPLIDVMPNYSDEFDTKYLEHVFKSHLYSNGVSIIGDCYYCYPIKSRTTRVFLMNVRYFDFITEKEDENRPNAYRRSEYKDAIEVYMETHKGIRPICSTAFVREEIETAVNRLYSSVNDSSSRIGLTGDVKLDMKAFLDEM